MKKMYIQPEMMIAPVEPVSIICFSSGDGGGTDELEENTTGDAPKRRTKVF